MRALDRLFKLHLIAEQYNVLCASRHCHNIRQAHLTCFVDEKEIQLIYPVFTCEHPRGPADDTFGIRFTGFATGLDEFKPRIFGVEFIVSIAADFDADKIPTSPPGDTGTLLQKIYDCLMAVRSYSDLPTVGEKLVDHSGSR